MHKLNCPERKYQHRSDYYSDGNYRHILLFSIPTRSKPMKVALGIAIAPAVARSHMHLCPIAVQIAASGIVSGRKYSRRVPMLSTDTKYRWTVIRNWGAFDSKGNIYS